MGLDKTGERDGDERDGRPDWSAVVASAVLVALALWSLPRAVQAGDAGEFATVMLTGGVPHPSGYPWMRVLGLVAQGLWQLGLPPAVAAAMPPALCGAGAWLVMQRSCARLGHPWLGAFVVVLCASSPLVLLHVNDSEVWGPHLLLCALFIHVVIDSRARPRPFLLGILLGVAVSQHLTAILLVPLAVAAALPRPVNQPERVLGNGGLGLLGSALGLSPYASLAIGRGGSWRWGETDTARGLWAHVTREDFGTFSLSLHEEQVAVTDSLGRALASVGEVWTGGLALHAAVGVLVLLASFIGAGLWLRRAEVDPALQRPAVGLGLSILASALAFPAAGNIDPTHAFGAWILERFDLLSVMLMALPIALALAWLRAQLDAALPDRRWIARAGVGAIGVALLAAQLAAVLERGRPATERGVEVAAVDLVSTPDPAGPSIPSATEIPIRAIVFGTDDHRSFPTLYAQEVLGAGPHTLYIDAELLAYPWYRARLRARVPSLPDVDKPLRMMGAIWSDPALAEVPIYIANVFSRPAAQLGKVPEGLLWRVPPPPGMPSHRPADWTASAVLDRHLAACERMRAQPVDFGGRLHPRGHPWSADLRFAYVDKARALATMLTAEGLDHRVPEVSAALEAHVGAGL